MVLDDTGAWPAGPRPPVAPGTDLEALGVALAELVQADHDVTGHWAAAPDPFAICKRLVCIQARALLAAHEEATR